jgi:multidrug efflux pump subunit AcrB
MNVSSWSIKNPLPTIVFFILLTMAGFIGFKSSTVQDFPDIELPIITVNASLPGAAPAQMETEIARKIENAVAPVQGVKNVFTNILDGSATINVEFVLEKNAAEATNEVRDAVASIRADLPAEMRDPIVSKVSNAGRPLLTYTVAAAAGAQTDEEAISWFVDNTVTKRVLTAKGVGRVGRIGGVNREILVELNTSKMAALGVTAVDVSHQLRRVQQEVPGGRGDVAGAEQAVRTIATVKTVTELASLDIPLSDGRRVRLDQIARVADTTAERRSQALLNGKPVVAFEIIRTKGAGEVDVAQSVRAAVEQLRLEHPNFEITESIDNVWPVKENFDGSMLLLLEGALLAVIVVWFFLRDWRSTFIAAIALPLSVAPTFLGMYFFGFTLNTVTLLSLALVVGILVDDAIVEIENIARHMRMGKSAYQASMEAADEIGLAVIATTFALIAVFLPTAFMAGIPGKFFKQFGWTAVFAIFASLVVARMLTPMMSAYMLRADKLGVHKPDSKVMTWYLGIVAWCVKFRWVTAVAAGLFFFGSIYLAKFLPTGFVPPSDRSQTLVNIELPPGSTLAETLAAAETARATVMTDKDVKSVFSSVGGGVSGDAFAIGVAAEARKAALTVTMSHRNDRSRNQQGVEVDLREKLSKQPGVRITVGAQDAGVKMQLVLQSEDPVALTAASREVDRDLRTLQGVGNVTSTASLVRPEIILRPNFARAAELGVTAAAIGETVRVATTGDYDQNLPKFNLSERQVPIRVQLPTEMRADIESIKRLQVPAKGGSVMLATVADVSIDSGPAQIDRLNRSRQVTFDVELGGRELGEVYNEALELPAFKQLPPSVKQVNIGDTEVQAELFVSFAIAMGIGIFCIYAVLVLLFRDVMQPITILSALLPSVGGAVIALLLTRKGLSMPSMIGLLMLMGVVTKNSILLVDYAIIARRDLGMSRFDALLDASHKRARPIVMTSIAMGFGMLPIAMGFGADPSFRSPMAIAVIGGLITSTVLSLVVVPAVFTITDDVEHLIARLFGRGNKTRTTGTPTAPPTAATHAGDD